MALGGVRISGPAGTNDLYGESDGIVKIQRLLVCSVRSRRVLVCAQCSPASLARGERAVQ
jgi:hypothetical protein